MLQQAAAGFGFLKEKDEKIQCVYGEEYFNYYMSKRRVHSKGFVVVTEKNAYFGGKMVLTTPGAPLVKEKGVRTLPLKDISAVGLGGKYMDKRKVARRRAGNYTNIVIDFFGAIFCILIGIMLMWLFGSPTNVSMHDISANHDIYSPVYQNNFSENKTIMPLSVYTTAAASYTEGMDSAGVITIISISLFLLGILCAVRGFYLIKHGGIAKVLFNVQHSNGTLQLAARMSKITMDPITEFVQHFNQCIENAKAAEEARIAEEERLAEEARAAEEERLAKEAAEEARLAEEKRLADEAAEKARLEKEAAAMQQAMEKAMQSAPASASNIAEELKAYSEMYKQGLINDEEFAAFKAKLLGK